MTAVRAIQLRQVRSYVGTLAAILGLAFYSLGPAAAAPKPRTHTVTIEGTRFQPELLTVNVGDTVVWVNKDAFPHTATAKPGPFDSGAITTGNSWKHTVKAKGEVAYICSYHPTMTGRLRVK
jgi:plastocyanin